MLVPHDGDARSTAVLLMWGCLCTASASPGCRAGAGAARTDDTPAVLVSPSRSAAAAAAAGPPTFAVIDVLDLRRRGVRNFVYSTAVDELLVSFTDDPSSKDALEQWSVGQGLLLHTWSMGAGWMVDEVFAAPTGKHAVARLVRVGDTGGGPWAKYALLDTAARSVVSGDLGLHDQRNVTVHFQDTRPLFCVTAPERSTVYGLDGRVSTAGPPCPPVPKGKLTVIESSKVTDETHGLYYTADDGQDYLVAKAHWHGNYGLTRDGTLVVTTTWDGEILVWDTSEKREVFRKKIAEHYGYLAYDGRRNRFLIGDAMYNGTTQLRALVVR
jgi:hypothetical protein